jgi:hypothetical protein
MEKILHHYVPCFYLRAWAHNDQIWCLRDRKSFLANVKKIGGEKYFYELPDLTQEDVRLLQEFVIDKCHPAGRHVHENQLKYFLITLLAKERAPLIPNLDPEKLREVNEVVANLDENWYTAIEDRFQPLLASMLHGDLTFLSERGKAIEFFHGIGTQYFRTKKRREAAVVGIKVPFQDVRRVWPLMTHIFAVNLGGHLFRTRADNQIIILENDTDIPFITGDQPIINVIPLQSDGSPAERIELYYPLSPTKAMLLVEDKIPRPTSLNRDQVINYNALIVAHSYDQIYANSEESLNSVFCPV